ncbi:Uncharacterized protein PBTT_09866 [Plasmodiophora brassicae]
MGPSDAVGGDGKSHMAVVRPSLFEQIAAPKLQTSDRPAIILFMDQLKTYNSKIMEKIALGENIAPIDIKNMLDEGMLATIFKSILQMVASMPSSSMFLMPIGAMFSLTGGRRRTIEDQLLS